MKPSKENFNCNKLNKLCIVFCLNSKRYETQAKVKFKFSVISRM